MIHKSSSGDNAQNKCRGYPCGGVRLYWGLHTRTCEPSCARRYKQGWLIARAVRWLRGPHGSTECDGAPHSSAKQCRAVANHARRHRFLFLGTSVCTRERAVAGGDCTRGSRGFATIGLREANMQMVETAGIPLSKQLAGGGRLVHGDT